jgi:hypothetical protein
MRWNYYFTELDVFGIYSRQLVVISRAWAVL